MSPSHEPDRSRGPLSDLRVLELGERVAAPYCAKLLADLGADVIKVERPSGDPARRRGPFRDDEPHPDRSALFLYLNGHKRGVTADLETDAGRSAFREWVAWADVLIEDRPPGALEASGLGPDALLAANPGLIIASITPFGQTGPNRGHASYHLNLYHASGHASPFESGALRARRAASKAGGQLGEYDAGLTAAVGVLGAVLHRERTGRGQHIDVSKQEAMMCLERVTIGRFANEPEPFSGRGGPGGLVRAKDGWFIVNTLEPRQWQGLVEAMGSPDWSREAWLEDPRQRMERRAEIDAHVAEWAADRSRDEIYHAVQAHGTPAGPVRDVSEVLDWGQTRGRGFFRELTHPDVGPLLHPTLAYLSSEMPWQGAPAPRLGEHDAEVAHGLPPREPRAADDPAAAAPLAGVRVLDFTWAWAGPQASLLLAMLGAEIIKVESHARLDHSRVHTLTAGSLSGGIDESPVFNDLNLGKRSVTLNLGKPEARDLVRGIAAKSDVVLQNMRPGVLDRLGLGYDDLCKVRPDLIMLSSSAVGATGPEASYTGYAPTFACLSGVVSISGHPDEPPIALSGSVDLRVGTASAFAVLTALHHRRRTGRGQHIDLSSTEVMSAMIGEAFLGYQLTGRVPERIGNRDASMAPHGCYRCRGEGEWITIAVGTEAEWEALCRVIDDPALARPEFGSAEARHRAQDALDEIIGRFTAHLPREEAVERLQGAGVAAAIVHDGASLARDPHVLARGVYETVEHPRMGPLKTVRPPWRLEGAATPCASPLIGEHNAYVLGEILGLSPGELDALVEARIVY